MDNGYSIARFKLTQVESDAWEGRAKASSGGWEACFTLSLNITGSKLAYFYVNAGEINPVDCAKKCLSKGFTGSCSGVDKSSCNAFTFQDGVCTLGCIEHTSGAHGNF